MREAAVGFQCPECVAKGAKQTRQGQAAYGGRRSADPRRTSIALIAVNVAVWLAVMATGGRGSRLLDFLMLTPRGECESRDGLGWYPNATSADLCATASNSMWTPGAVDGGWWQMVTSGFAHVDVLHIALNCLAIWVLGPAVEAALGRARFLALYFISLVFGSLTVLWFSEPYVSSLGASGAVFGLLAAMLLLVWKVGGDIKGLAMVIAVNVFITVSVPNISWQAHLGGFVGGAAVTALIIFAPRGPQRARVQWIGMGALAVLAVGLFVARVLVLHST